MATIRYLSWNIQTYGPKKYGNNGATRIDFIGNVILGANANVVAIMELAPSTADDILGDLVFWLFEQTGDDWKYKIVIEKPNNTREAYGILWAPEQGFELDNDRCGWANYDALGNYIDMPSKDTLAGGRRPIYATFLTEDTNQRFSIIVYHAPFSDKAIQGDRNLARSMMISQVPTNPVNVNGGRVAVSNCLLSGDFNIDYITDSIPSAYQPLRNNPPGMTSIIQGVNNGTQRSSLQSQINPLNPGGNPEVYSQNSVSYRANAYDNIFYKYGPVNGQVVDVIALMNRPMVIPPNPNNPNTYWARLAYIARQFDLTLERGARGLNQGVIGRDMSDNWLFYLSCISDHLPVYAQAVI